MISRAEPSDRFDTFVEDVQVVQRSQMENQRKYTGAIPKNSSPQVALISNQKAEHLPKNWKSTVDLINSGVRVCVILRGLPGSGKSFLSYQLVDQTVKTAPNDHIASADKFFINNRGQYNFVPEKIKEAHEAAQRSFTQKACQGLSPLIADNTHLEYWEMYYYLQVANQYGYRIVMMEPETPWKFSEGNLAKKNQHSVPFEKIKQMKKKYETGLTVEQLLMGLNLQPVIEPLKRNIPPITKPSVGLSNWLDTCDLITFNEDKPPPPPPEPVKNEFQWAEPNKVFEDDWNAPKEPPAPVEKKVDAQPQRKPRKNKPQSKQLSPHRKNCPNENQSFSQIRELYSNVNDKYLWDLFERCNGDADWCVNLLCDENLTDQMEAGNDLSCECFGSDVTKAPPSVKAVTEVPKQPQSPVGKSKKSKQIVVDDWIKESIENSVRIGDEHFPDHVNMVRNWKKGPQPTEEVVTNGERPETPVTSSDGEENEELQALTIGEKLLLELDDEFGGGFLRSVIDDKNFPPKIFVKKSTAHKLYIEIMDAYYSQKEETRFTAEKMQMKLDEEYAKKLMNEENPVQTQPSTWINDDESSDDIALRMSKEKLIQLFPGIEKDDLMQIFEGENYKFNETVKSIQDSLNLTPEQRKSVETAKKKLFNTPWGEGKSKAMAAQKKVVQKSSTEGYTDEHLNTVETLRQSVIDHREEQQVCLNKSREYHQKKKYEEAMFFSNMAQFHKLKAEEANHAVANLISGIHEKTHDSHTTVDLHYFNLVEAATMLDTFLDKNISRLRAIKKPYEDLQIITGRGAHSANGVASIKNKTKTRLKERNLNFEEKNPGLLRVKIFPQSKLCNEF